MNAWGYWRVEDVVYRVMAHCGSSCEHIIIKELSPKEWHLAHIDIFQYFVERFKKDFDYRHDSAKAPP